MSGDLGRDINLEVNSMDSINTLTVETISEYGSNTRHDGTPDIGTFYTSTVPQEENNDAINMEMEHDFDHIHVIKMTVIVSMWALFVNWRVVYMTT